MKRTICFWSENWSVMRIENGKNCVNTGMCEKERADDGAKEMQQNIW